MFGFKAYFLNDRVYINDVAYRNNEILTSLLNLPRKNLPKLVEELKRHRKRVTLVEDDYALCMQFNDFAHDAQECLFKVGNLIKAISPYQYLPETNLLDTPLLFERLNKEYAYWVDGLSKGDEQKDPDYISRYDFSDRDDDENYDFGNDRFFPDVDALLKPDEEIRAAVDKTNQAVEELFDDFIRIVQDLIRVKDAYSVLLDQFINAQNRFLTAEETAQTFTAFLEATKNKAMTSRVISSGTMKMSYEVYRRRDRSDHLCEAYAFNSLGAFLYFDFFRGLSRQYIPRRCDNCGRYFLQRGGRYSNYCDNPLKEDRRKTCRDVGARRKYDDKCKTDPVWLAYNRAYKAHYARYMKKKMTTAEFEQWSRYAVELRVQAESGAILFEAYQAEIKK